MKYAHRKCEDTNLALQSSVSFFHLRRISLRYMLMVVLLLSFKCVCCFVFSFKHLQLSTNHPRLCEVFAYVLVSVEETLAETANKGNKSVCKMLYLYLPFLGISKIWYVFLLLLHIRGEKISQVKWDLQRWHRL